jgi:hypothetical protein
VATAATARCSGCVVVEVARLFLLALRRLLADTANCVGYSKDNDEQLLLL